MKLNRYCIEYTDAINPGFGEAPWYTSAYNVEHALDRFYDSSADGESWKPLRIAKVNPSKPRHAWNWIKLGGDT